MLQGKKILLGVTGSIAAYKTPELVRQLVQQGASVKVIITAAAKDFVSPLVLATVSKNEALQTFTSEDHSIQTFTSEDHSTWNNHVELGLWCDIFLVAPLSANTLAKFANGNCDNLLTAVFLSCRNTVMVAPAMDVDMFKHASTQKNLEIIAKNNIKIIGPESGELASGLTGKGRMTEPEDIVQEVINYFNPSLPLRNKMAVVTTGPTQEALDPVRFIGNHSSGKMGVAVANCLAAKGASVILISGPSVSLGNLNKSIKVIHVTSAADMLKACKQTQPDANIMVMAAAVADFKPEGFSEQKIKKKSSEGLNIQLVPTEDIAAEMGKLKKEGQLLVGFALETNDETGFALETNDETQHAERKLKNKNLDFIVLNKLEETNQVFGSDFNRITIIDKNLVTTPFEKKSKDAVASDIVEKIITLVQ